MTKKVDAARGDVKSSALWGTGTRGGDHRSNALWGSGRGGEHRSNVLWGKGARKLAAALIALVTLALPLGAGAATTGSSDHTYVAPAVFQLAKKDANDKIQVIIQSTRGVEGAKQAAHGLGSVKKELGLIDAVAMEMPAGRAASLAKKPGLIVTLDAPMKAASYTSTQLWPHQNGVAKLWGTALAPAPKAPTIAIVDSGIDPSAGFGSRVVHREVFTSFPQDPSKSDGRGHGTFVAGIAAGEAVGYAGASPTSNLIDLDVIDDQGMARTSDVITAAQWIYANRAAYNIRVANFSLHSSSALSIRYHPLNKAVQKLWFGNVVVVAAAGNYGSADGPSGVPHSPGNDPFVITVGAFDLGGTSRLGDDAMAPWSAYGYTNEGFAKPDVVAAGRYLVAPVPAGATLATDRPDRVVAPGYMRLSGTSFAAPIVAGVAAQILARNPSFNADQVKGALMQTARRVPEATRLQQGRGEVNAVRASAVTKPVHANAALGRFVVSDPAGGDGRVFDASAWYDAMRGDSAWDSSAWTDSGWSDSAWSDSAWSDSAWTDSAWNDSAWTDSAWTDSTAYEDNSAGEGVGSEYVLTPLEEQAIAEDPALALPDGSSTTTAVTTAVTGRL